MTLTATTHLNFRGDARQALDLYQRAFGGALTIVTNQQGGRPGPADEAGQVLFGQVQTADGFHVMAYDVPAVLPWRQGENAMYVVVQATSAEAVHAAWAALADGGAIAEALAPSPWAPLSGKLKDRFGVTWVLSVQAATPS